MPGIWESTFSQPQQPQQSAFGQGNMFFQPGNSYGANQSHYSSPISQMMRERELPLAYSSFLGRQGVADNDTMFNRWAYQQFPRFERAYGQATMENPYITIDQFLATLPTVQGLQQQFMNLSPQARGLDFARTAPVARWIGR